MVSSQSLFFSFLKTRLYYELRDSSYSIHRSALLQDFVQGRFIFSILLACELTKAGSPDVIHLDSGLDLVPFLWLSIPSKKGYFLVHLMACCCRILILETSLAHILPNFVFGLRCVLLLYLRSSRDFRITPL